MEKTYCIYCHTNKINGKKYIGQTGGDLQKRFGENGYCYRKQMFGRAIKKYGWDNFEHTVLEQGLTLEEANIKEEYYILKYKTTDSAFGYNVRAGGNNSTLSNEMKEKLSNSLHKYYENNDVWNKGLKGEYHLHITDERKKQLVEQMKGNEKALGYQHSEEAIKEQIDEIHLPLARDEGLERRYVLTLSWDGHGTLAHLKYLPLYVFLIREIETAPLE